MVLDGGLATALEARGCDLDDELWSARILIEAPELIRDVHRDFLAAGADCITTSSYQASLPGFHKRGLSEARVKREVDALIKRSMEETWVFGRLPGSPHFKNVMAAAIEAAGDLKSQEVCSEHLLLGLLQEDGSVAHAALSKLGITPEVARADVVRFTSAAPEAT